MASPSLPTKFVQKHSLLKHSPAKQPKLEQAAKASPLTSTAPPDVHILSLTTPTRQSIGDLACGSCGTAFFRNVDDFVGLLGLWAEEPINAQCFFRCNGCSGRCCPVCGNIEGSKGHCPAVVAQNQPTVKDRLRPSTKRQKLANPDGQDAPLVPEWCCKTAISQICWVALIIFDYEQEKRAKLVASLMPPPEVRRSSRYMDHTDWSDDMDDFDAAKSTAHFLHGEMQAIKQNMAALTQKIMAPPLSSSVHKGGGASPIGKPGGSQQPQPQPLGLPSQSGTEAEKATPKLMKTSPPSNPSGPTSAISSSNVTSLTKPPPLSSKYSPFPYNATNYSHLYQPSKLPSISTLNSYYDKVDPLTPSGGKGDNEFFKDHLTLAPISKVSPSQQACSGAQPSSVAERSYSHGELGGSDTTNHHMDRHPPATSPSESYESYAMSFKDPHSSDPVPTSYERTGTISLKSATKLQSSITKLESSMKELESSMNEQDLLLKRYAIEHSLEYKLPEKLTNEQPLSQKLQDSEGSSSAHTAIGVSTSAATADHAQNLIEMFKNAHKSPDSLPTWETSSPDQLYPTAAQTSSDLTPTSLVASGTGYGGSSGYDYEDHSAGLSWSVLGKRRVRKTDDTRAREAYEQARSNRDFFIQRTLRLLCIMLKCTRRESAESETQAQDIAGFILSSTVLDMAAEILRNDCLEDAVQRRSLCYSLFELIRKLVQHPTTRHLVYLERAAKSRSNLLYPPTGKDGIVEMQPSLESCMMNLTKQCRVVLGNKSIKRVRKSDLADTLDLSKNVVQLSDFLSIKAPSTLSTAQSPLASNTSSTDSQMLWHKFHAAHAFSSVPDDLICSSHAFASEAEHCNLAPIGRMKRLISEGANLSTSLPPGIFVRHAETRPDILKALIVGPCDTPYAHGLFEFDLWCTSEYPNAPPKCKFKTTGGGRAHFNPNLYAEGHVCLSLLNTWDGEMWAPGRSTILQILVSLQAMVLCEMPWFNEPGRETDGWEGAKEEAERYNEDVRALTVRWALLDWVKKMCNDSQERENAQIKAITRSDQSILKDGQKKEEEDAENRALPTANAKLSDEDSLLPSEEKAPISALSSAPKSKELWADVVTFYILHNYTSILDCSTCWLRDTIAKEIARSAASPSTASIQWYWLSQKRLMSRNLASLASSIKALLLPSQLQLHPRVINATTTLTILTDAERSGIKEALAIFTVDIEKQLQILDAIPTPETPHRRHRGHGAFSALPGSSGAGDEAVMLMLGAESAMKHGDKNTNPDHTPTPPGAGQPSSAYVQATGSVQPMITVKSTPANTLTATNAEQGGAVTVAMFPYTSSSSPSWLLAGTATTEGIQQPVIGSVIGPGPANVTEGSTSGLMSSSLPHYLAPGESVLSEMEDDWDVVNASDEVGWITAPVTSVEEDDDVNGDVEMETDAAVEQDNGVGVRDSAT